MLLCWQFGMRGHSQFIERVLLSAFCFLLFLAYVAQQGDKATLKSSTVRPILKASALVKTKRAEKAHVILPTEFSYVRGGGVADYSTITNVTFGGNQSLRLSVTPQHVTWVPQEPSSRLDFCNKLVNPQNELGCEAAGRSNYYTANINSNFSRVNSFWFNESYPDVRIKTNATGYWAEDKITVDGMDVQLKFGVALQWHTPPILGLGIQPVFQDKRYPGYLDALKQQGRITGRFASFYNHMTPNTIGEIVLGGIDSNKFVGKLAVWEEMDGPGVVYAPTVRMSDGFGRFWGPYENPGSPVALVDPIARSLLIPRNMYTDLLKVLSGNQYGLQEDQFGNVGFPCTRNGAPDEVLELNFGQGNISIQFNHLRGIELEHAPALCRLDVEPTEAYMNISRGWSFVLGGPFFKAAYALIDVDNNGTALGVLNPNPIGRNIIELGGNLTTSLYRITGVPEPVSTPFENSVSDRTLSSGEIAGTAIAAFFVLTISTAGAIFFLRKKSIPDIPLPENNLSELGPDTRPLRELEAKPVSHELLVSSVAAHELAVFPNELTAPPHELEVPPHELEVPSAIAPCEIPANTG
ncbi:hypothetical protein TWF718_009246 [Orbilia javanica]|uniref:Peptidase A1 domain-containing protein n=1 Tax=Orbilia javanica TaxID=47235 RepID=A0AAN8MVR5_9PEZI